MHFKLTAIFFLGSCFSQLLTGSNLSVILRSFGSKVGANGECGGTFGSCTGTECCSRYGWCGTSAAHCGNGCQLAFGRCNSVATSAALPKTTTAPIPVTASVALPKTSVDLPATASIALPQTTLVIPPVSKSAASPKASSVASPVTTSIASPASTVATPVSTAIVSARATSSSPLPAATLVATPDGTCGTASVGRYTCGASCCSRYGYCGTTAAYCATGCQIGYGRCNASSSSSSAAISITTLAAKSSTVNSATSSSAVASATVTTVPASKSSSAAPLPTAFPPINPALAATIQNQCVTAGHVALTFDDGPADNLQDTLNMLRAKNAVGTFFVNGQNYVDITTNPAAAQRIRDIYNAGHQIGSHTFRHADLATLGNQAMWNEMRLLDNALKALIGVRPIHVRLPFLSSSQAVLNALGSWGYRVVGVNLDTKDYAHTNPATQVEQNKAQYLSQLQQGFPSWISLQHERMSETGVWLDYYIDDLRARGYTLVTAATCLGDGAMYRA